MEWLAKIRRFFVVLKLKRTGQCWVVKRFKVAGAPGYTVYMPATKQVIGAGMRRGEAVERCHKMNVLILARLTCVSR